MVRRPADLGCDAISLGDTVGVATPGLVHELLEAPADVGITADRLAVHFHDTYGQAMSNTPAALQADITVLDTSAGGLGGAPTRRAPPGAPQRLAHGARPGGRPTGPHGLDTRPGADGPAT